MSDFGSLLNQFQRDAKQWASSAPESSSRRRDTSSRPTTSSTTEDEETSRKRPRTQQRQQPPDFSSFPVVKRVYCLCPNVQTGGPEALHQLCDQLNRQTKVKEVSAYMVYVRSNGQRVHVVHGAKKPSAYESLYDAPVIAEEESNLLTKSPAPQDCLLIWPECWTDELLQYLGDNNNVCPCAIWWLSVDNNTRKYQDWHRQDILHLYQSEYAHHYLLKHGAKHCLPMTEYISNVPSSNSKTDRTIDVLYNPLKGIHYTDAIRKRSGHLLQFRPIGGGPDGRERISPEEVRELLQQAKIYMDFGPHPGMDRLPREAALAGCAVITNRAGAAGFEEDVPLPAKYKLKEFDVDAIHRMLVDLKDNFEERTGDYDEYRRWIRTQSERMEQCVGKLLNELVTKREGGQVTSANGNTDTKSLR